MLGAGRSFSVNAGMFASNRSAKIGAVITTDAAGTFAPSGIITFSVLQQPFGICGQGDLFFCGKGFWQQPPSSAGVWLA